MTTLESLYDIAHNNGIVIENYDLPNTVSVSAKINDRCYIGIDRSKINNSSEKAVHIAHEIGHCETDSMYAQNAQLAKRCRSERRAETWAINHLVPPEVFRAAYDNGCREIWEFAEELNVTCEFAIKVMLFYKRSGNWI